MKKTLFIIVLILVSIASQAQKMTVKRVTTKQVSDTGTWYALREAPITPRTYYLETKKANDTYKAFLKVLKLDTLDVKKGYVKRDGTIYKLVVFTSGSDATKAQRDITKDEIIKESK